ncbi:MAG: TIGR04282 family arsenosugar biosynthesis glycosyltransferase [Hyphomicrobiales bacterium]
MNHLVIMAKAPQAGLVKTRLAREIGTAEALRTYRAMLGETVRNLGRDERWQTWLAVAPDISAFSNLWPPYVGLIRQGGGNLGDKMQRIFDCLPPGPAIIIGSDIPRVKPGEIAQGFKTLGNCEAVLGPAPDGGYWLIGLSRRIRVERPFSGVRWSSAHARADTLANLAHINVGYARERRDLDTVSDYMDWLAGKLG